MTLAHDPSNRQAWEARLRPFGQEQLLAQWDSLTPAERASFAAELGQVDFELIDRLWHASQGHVDWPALCRRAESPPAIRLDGPNPFTAGEAHEQGRAALAAGRVGAVLVAGGQGTRLGFDHPKGMYRIGPVSGASLFQVLFEKLRAVARRYGVSLPLYLMTSPATHAETLAFLDHHARFGLPAEDLFVFCQGTMPAVDAATGRLLLAAPGALSLSPDGHGGLLKALRASGALADMRRRGLEHLFYMQVDNPLVSVCDPEFIGYHLLERSELSTQVVAKRTPHDRVGNVVSVDGQVRIIEYIHLTEEAAGQRLADSSLKLWAGNIAVHVLEVALLERISKAGAGLPFHRAHKKVSYIDDAGRLVEPNAPNAVKFEQFIFDLLPAAHNPIVVEVDEATCFAPLKNGSGHDRDSPETVRARMISLHASWLRQARAVVSSHVPVEISPLFALDADELAGKIAPGQQVAEATYFA